MPTITRTRRADEHNVVRTIAGGTGDYCRRPCAECPWKKVNNGKFPAEAFRISAETSYDMASNTFACHMRGPDNIATCAGFILHGSADNLAVRMKRASGQMHDVEGEAGTIHKSYRDMAIANGVSADDPVLKPCMPEARATGHQGQFVNGYCAEWAVAYQKFHPSGKLKAFLLEYEEDGTAAVDLLHVFVWIDGKALDAKGPRSVPAIRQDLFVGFPGRDPKTAAKMLAQAKVRLRTVTEKYLSDMWGLDNYALALAKAQIMRTR